MPAPRKRSGVAVAAMMRKGAGTHKENPRDVVTEADWDAADYSRFGKEHNMQMTLKEFRVEHGINDGADMADALKDWCSDSVVPALCHDGCEVEPDGHCQHDCPSILVKLGVI
jgi:hypothetical protein